MKGDIEMNNLDYLAKEAADQFIQNNIPLNESIIKIAENSALNPEEINRVVENANNSVYLALFKTADDKYIEFPVADSEKIAAALDDKYVDIDSLSDYDVPPSKELQDLEIFPTNNESGSEKTASVSDSEILREFQKAQSEKQRQLEKIALYEGEFTEAANTLYGTVKQAVLSGESFGMIKVAMKHRFPGEFTEKIMENFEDRLINKEHLFNLDVEEREEFTKIAISLADIGNKIKNLKTEDVKNMWDKVKNVDLSKGTDFIKNVPNHINDLHQKAVKNSGVYDNMFNQLEDLVGVGKNALNRIKGLAGKGTEEAATVAADVAKGESATTKGATLGDTAKKIKKGLKYGAIGAGTLGAAKVVYNTGKEKAYNETSALNSVPKKYRSY